MWERQIRRRERQIRVQVKIFLTGTIKKIFTFDQRSFLLDYCTITYGYVKGNSQYKYMDVLFNMHLGYSIEANA